MSEIAHGFEVAISIVFKRDSLLFYRHFTFLLYWYTGNFNNIDLKNHFFKAIMKCSNTSYNAFFF